VNDISKTNVSTISAGLKCEITAVTSINNVCRREGGGMDIGSNFTTITIYR